MVTLDEEATPNYTTVTGAAPPVTQPAQPAQPAALAYLPTSMEGMTDKVTSQQRVIDQLLQERVESQATVNKLTLVGMDAGKLLAAVTGGTNVGVVGAGAQSAESLRQSLGVAQQRTHQQAIASDTLVVGELVVVWVESQAQWFLAKAARRAHHNYVAVLEAEGTAGHRAEVEVSKECILKADVFTKIQKDEGATFNRKKAPGDFSLEDISKYDRLGALLKHVICTQYGWGALCDIAIGLGFKLNAIDINTFLSSIERKLQGIPNVSNSFFEVPGGSMAPPERVAGHLSLVIEQARLKPEAKRQKADDTNLESSKTTEHALVVLTSPVYQEKLSKTAKALAAPGGGITVATDLFARYSPGNTDGFDAQLLRVARSSGTLGSSVNTDAQLLLGVRKGTTDAMVAVASSDDT